jgi:hypothetical protein
MITMIAYPLAADGKAGMLVGFDGTRVVAAHGQLDFVEAERLFCLTNSKADGFASDAPAEEFLFAEQDAENGGFVLGSILLKPDRAGIHSVDLDDIPCPQILPAGEVVSVEGAREDARLVLGSLDVFRPLAAGLDVGLSEGTQGDLHVSQNLPDPFPAVGAGEAAAVNGDVDDRDDLAAVRAAEGFAFTLFRLFEKGAEQADE